MSTRVLHIITRLELGGAQRNTLFTVAHLERPAHAVGLAWGPGDRLDGEARGLDEVALFPVADLVRPLSARRDVAALGALRGVIREFKPHIVHTHSSKAGILGRFAARLEATPVVVHSIHGWGFTPLQSPFRRSVYVLAERIAARWTTHFIAVSHANRRQGIERRLFPPDRCTVIRSGIDLERFRNLPDKREARDRFGLPRDGLVVVQVSNFKPQKAPLDFVRAASVAAEHVRDVVFVIVGDGPLRGQAQALGDALGLGSRLFLPGWSDEIAAAYAAADVVALSSRHEGLPRAVVEALAAGLPVVATAVDGTPEVVRHGENGFLVEPGDVAQLGIRLAELLADGARRRRMGAEAPRGLDEFDIHTMVRQQEELYGCLTRRPS
jgi:glycosyltransferase involved in cell wall biosynthesis